MPLLSEVVGEELFGFFKNKEIHNVISMAQELLHSMKKKNLKAIILKLDISKSYNRVSWNFLMLK
jgi:hypothetical protein